MDNTILRGNSRLGDVVVTEINCIKVEGGLGLLIDDMIAAVVVEGGTKI